MKKFLRSLLSGAFLVSVVYLALGIVLIIMPELTMEAMVRVGALAIIVVGIVSLIMYLFRGVKGGHLNNHMAAGLTALAAGITLLIKPELVTAFVPTLMGIAIMVDGFGKLQRSMDMLRIKFGGWLLILIMALVTLVGAALVFAAPFKNPNTLTIVIGVSFVFAGAAGIAIWIVVGRQMKKYRDKLAKDAQLKELADAAGVSVEALEAAKEPALLEKAEEPGMPEITDAPAVAEEAVNAVAEEANAAPSVSPLQAEPYVPGYRQEENK